MLDATVAPSGQVDLARFDQFRRRLLWHIAVEERLLMPRLIECLGRPPRFQKGMRKDHEGLVALCVATPNAEWIENLRELLGYHNQLEEQENGLFALVDQHFGDDPLVLAAIDGLPPPEVPPFSDERVGEQIHAVMSALGLAPPSLPH